MEKDLIDQFKRSLKSVKGDNVGMARAYFKFVKFHPNLDSTVKKEVIKLFFTYGGVINEETRAYFTELELKDSSSN